jgi:RNA polymerase sigma factor (sigma-70 family)
MTPLLLRTQTDERLLALAANGHDRAFEVIVERYRKPLLRYLRRLLSEPLAEDVVQATFLNAWRALQAGTGVRELRPWLYRIGHNQAINALKRAGAVLEPLPEGGPVALVGLGPEEEVERRDEMRTALEGVAALPDRQRTALLAVAVEGRAHADVAAELGLTDGAVRQLVHRARSSLRAVATAITPTPIATALASSHDVTAGRIAELAAGAGGAGLTSFAIKASAVAVTAGAVVAGVPQRDASHAHRAPAKVAVASVAPSSSQKAATTVSDNSAPAVSATPVKASAKGRHRRGKGSGSSGRRGQGERHGSSGTSRRPTIVVPTTRHHDSSDEQHHGDKHSGNDGADHADGETHGGGGDAKGRKGTRDEADKGGGKAPNGGGDSASHDEPSDQPQSDSPPSAVGSDVPRADDSPAPSGGGGGGTSGAATTTGGGSPVPSGNSGASAN